MGVFLVEPAAAKRRTASGVFCAALTVKAGCAAPIVKFTDSKVIFYIHIYIKSINGMLMFCPSLYFFPKKSFYLDYEICFLYN